MHMSSVKENEVYSVIFLIFCQFCLFGFFFKQASLSHIYMTKNKISFGVSDELLLHHNTRIHGSSVGIR